MNELERRQLNDAMVRLANGDRSAFDAVFGGLWGPLSDYVRRAVHDHPDAEDLAQQTLLNVFARISEFDTARDGVSWAFGIATFEIRTMRKKIHRRRETSIEDVAIADSRPLQEVTLIDNDLRELLVAVMGQLRQSDQEILLGGARGPSEEVSPAAWRKRRQRALERLRNLWGSPHD